MRRRTVPIVVSIVVLIAAALLFAGWTARDRAARNRFAAQLVHGNPALGPDKIRKYGCYTCHVIPGVDGAKGLVGPSLAGFRVAPTLLESCRTVRKTLRAGFNIRKRSSPAR